MQIVQQGVPGMQTIQLVQSGTGQAQAVSSIISGLALVNKPSIIYLNLIIF